MKIKAYTKILITLIIYSLVIEKDAVYAWDDCPKGKVNDPYPGDCARYIDTDNNGICDHSEPAPKDRVTTNTTTDIQDSMQNQEQVASEKSTTITPQNQLAPTKIANSTSNEQNSTFWSKSLTAIIIVFLHLVGFLTYTSYRKVALRNG